MIPDTISVLIKTLAGHYNEILFGSNPVGSFCYQAERNDKIRIQYPLSSTNNRLRMFKDEVNAYWLFIVVLKLINGCVIAIFVSIRRYGMTHSDITPAQALLNQFPILWWKRGRPTTKIFADVANILNIPLLVIYGCPQWNPSRV